VHRQGLDPQGAGELVDGDRPRRVEGAEDEVVPAVRHAADRRRVVELHGRSDLPAVGKRRQRGDQEKGRTGQAGWPGGERHTWNRRPTWMAPPGRPSRPCPPPGSGAPGPRGTACTLGHRRDATGPEARPRRPHAWTNNAGVPQKVQLTTSCRPCHPYRPYRRPPWRPPRRQRPPSRLVGHEGLVVSSRPAMEARSAGPSG